MKMYEMKQLLDLYVYGGGAVVFVMSGIIIKLLLDNRRLIKGINKLASAVDETVTEEDAYEIIGKFNTK